MFFLVRKKIINNKWLMLCLLIGSILAVAMVASIPIYSDGILQRMLTKDLEQFQTDTGYYPGRYVMGQNFFVYNYGEGRVAVFNWFEQRVDSQMAAKLGLPYQKVERLGMDYMTFLPAVQKEDHPGKTNSKLYGITDFDKHVQIVAGRLPANEPVNGEIEVIAPVQSQKLLSILLDEELVMTDETGQIKEPFKVKIVGLYKKPDTPDVWWTEPESNYYDSFFMDFNLFKSEFVVKDNAIISAYWCFTLDYTKLTVENLTTFSNELTAQKKLMMKYAGTIWDFPAQSILDQYAARKTQLMLILWVLQIPLLLMLAFYIFMVSQLIIENDGNEIAVIKSRGASGFQVFGSYLIQSLIISGISVAIGPFVAMAICRMLGASNGFLEFVSRTALPLKMSWRSLLYALCTGCFSVFMMMIPAIRASKVTIVEHKQKKARSWSAPLWQKMFLDVIFLGASIYGLYQYNLRQKTILVTAVKGVNVPVDPFLFIISTAFVIGAGLLFLRLYPYIIRFISWLGRKFWPPVLHTSLVQVGRSGGREQFLMLFLILTISIGVFSANSARTINQNVVDKVNYKNGADITLQMYWPSNKIVTSSSGGPPSDQSSLEQMQAQAQVVTYMEPDFNIYSKVAGTMAAAKVFIPESQTGITNQQTETKYGKLMAIVPNEFGKVVLSTPKLLPYPINDYLNLLAKAPNAVLVSNDLMKDLNLKPGDPITYSWGKQGSVDGVVYASVKFWPGLNPYQSDSKYFIISNLNFLQASTSI